MRLGERKRDCEKGERRYREYAWHCCLSLEILEEGEIVEWLKKEGRDENGATCVQKVGIRGDFSANGKLSVNSDALLYSKLLGIWQFNC